MMNPTTPRRTQDALRVVAAWAPGAMALLAMVQFYFLDQVLTAFFTLGLVVALCALARVEQGKARADARLNAQWGFAHAGAFKTHSQLLAEYMQNPAFRSAYEQAKREAGRR